MEDFGPPFFMKEKLKLIFFSPVTHFNILTIGVLVCIQGIHTHAHYTMDVDADSYVFQFCKKNVDKCKRFINR